MTTKLNILHVEDSEKIILLLKLMLVNSNRVHSIESARTITQAKEKIGKQKTDVVVLDIQLPDGNGIDFLKWVKEIHPEIKVVMLSNHADEFHRDVAKKSGANHFFDKSTEFEKVSAVIAHEIA